MDDLLRAMARAVIDDNRYMTLGTINPDGRPRVSPVYFTHDGYRRFYWVSEPTTRHSRNIAERPDVAIVVFDSTVAIGAGEAVYLDATAREVPAEDVPAECAVAYRTGPVSFTPAELSGAGPLRLYRADASTVEAHIRGGHPTLGTGIDRRLRVPLT